MIIEIIRRKMNEMRIKNELNKVFITNLNLNEELIIIEMKNLKDLRMILYFLHLKSNLFI